MEIKMGTAEIIFLLLTGVFLLVIQIRQDVNKRLPIFGTLLSKKMFDKIDNIDKILAICAFISLLFFIYFVTG